jgi:hypothetical protein
MDHHESDPTLPPDQETRPVLLGGITTFPYFYGGYFLVVSLFLGATKLFSNVLVSPGLFWAPEPMAPVRDVIVVCKESS